MWMFSRSIMHTRPQRKYMVQSMECSASVLNVCYVYVVGYLLRIPQLSRNQMLVEVKSFTLENLNVKSLFQSVFPSRANHVSTSEIRMSLGFCMKRLPWLRTHMGTRDKESPYLFDNKVQDTEGQSATTLGMYDATNATMTIHNSIWHFFAVHRHVVDCFEGGIGWIHEQVAANALWFIKWPCWRVVFD